MGQGRGPIGRRGEGGQMGDLLEMSCISHPSASSGFSPNLKEVCDRTTSTVQEVVICNLLVLTSTSTLFALLPFVSLNLSSFCGNFLKITGEEKGFAIICRAHCQELYALPLLYLSFSSFYFLLLLFPTANDSAPCTVLYFPSSLSPAPPQKKSRHCYSLGVAYKKKVKNWKQRAWSSFSSAVCGERKRAWWLPLWITPCAHHSSSSFALSRLPNFFIVVSLVAKII